MARASTKPPEPVATPALVPQGNHAGKQSMPISRPLTVIGSRHRAHLHLLSRSVSKSHAVIGMEDGGVYIRDLASRTHVFVNGKMVREADLRDGDLVKIGSFTFKMSDKRKGPLLEKPKRPAPAAIEVDGSAVPIEFDGRVMLIGRRPTCDISLMEMSVSTCHAVIFEHAGQRYIRDLGSRTGTFLNGQLVHQAPINVGDALRVGETDMKLVPHGPSALADDLEDLIGTAPLVDEMLTVAGEDLAPPPTAKAAPARKASSPPAPAAPIAPAEVEPEPGLKPIEPPAAEPAIARETESAPIPVAEPAPPRPAPAAGKPPVADPAHAHGGDVIQIEHDEPPHLLVDANLYTDAMSGSGTFTGIPGEVEQANSEAALDAASTEPVDLGLDFWHDEPSATPRAYSPADSPAAPPPADEEVSLPLLGVEEPDEHEPADSPAAPIAKHEAEAPAPAISPEPPAAESAPLELGPELTAPSAAEGSVESAMPGLILPAASIESAAEIAPVIPPVAPHSAPAPELSADAEIPKEIDLSHVQFTPEAVESADEWETQESEPAAPTSLLGLDISPPAPAAEVSLPPAVRESEDALAGPAEPDSAAPAEPKAESTKPAKPKRKPRRRKTKAAPAEPISAEPVAPAPPAPAEPAPMPEVIAELEPLAGSAAEPTEAYSSPAPLVEPIPESQVSAAPPASLDLPIEEPAAAVEPLAPMEESLEPALELESTAEPTDLPIEDDSELVEVDDSLEFNFDQPADSIAPESPEETGPAWIADAQTRLPEADQQQTFEPTSLLPTPEEEPELPLPEISESAGAVEPAAPASKSPEPANAGPAAPQAPPALDPFRGMGNDVGSFIGGLPLPLPPAKVPVDDGSSLVFPKPPPVPVAPLDVSEPPPELFETQPEALDALPDSLDTIEDVEQAIGNRPPPAARQPVMPPRPRRQGPGGSALPFGSTPLAPDAPPTQGVIGERKGKAPATARRGQVTTAFDGLALQPVRQADVFSNLNGPQTDGELAGADGGLGGAPADALRSDAGADAAPPIPPPTSLTGALPELPADIGKRTSRAYLDRKGLRPIRAGRGAEMVEADLVNADPSTADFGGPGVEQHGSMPRRAVAAQPGAPSPQFLPMPAMPAASRFSRRPRLHVSVLLPLMLLVAGGLAALIWFGMPVTFTHIASLRYSNLEKVQELRRQDFVHEEYTRAGSPDVLALAQELYSKTGRAGQGFLNPASSPENRMQLADLLQTMTVPDGTSTLVVTLKSRDQFNDAARLNALMHALSEKDKTLHDEAGRLNAALDDAKNRKKQLSDEIAQLSEKRKAELVADSQLPALKAAYDEQNGKVSQLYDNWQAAQRHRADLEQDLHFLETNGAGAAGSPSAQPAVQPDDSESKDLAAQVDQIQSQLAAIRSKNNSTAEQANAALGQALQQFHQKVVDAQAKLQQGSALSNYLTYAQTAQQAIQDQRAEVTEEEKTFQQHLTEMKDQLAALQKRQNEAIWAADPQLHDWEQDLEIKQHHYEAAAGSGLEDDAAKIKVDIDKLEAQISARRDTLTAQNPSTATIASIQKLIDDSLAERAKEQARDDKRMADQMQQLAAAAPKLSELPTDQKALAQDLEKQQEQLDQARQQYALALQSGPQIEDTTKQLETQLTDLTAKLSAHRKELMEENRKISSDVQAKVVENQIKDKEGQLAAAKQQEADALIAYEQSQQPLRAATTAWQDAVTLDHQLSQDEASLAKANEALDAASDDVAEDQQKVLQVIDPETPPQNVVQTSAPSDNRFEYMFLAVLATALVFSPLIYMASQPARPAGEMARPPIGSRPPQSALPPRPMFGNPIPPPSPLGGPPGQLTSLTAAVDADVDADKGIADAHASSDTDEPSSPDAIPAGF